MRTKHFDLCRGALFAAVWSCTGLAAVSCGVHDYPHKIPTAEPPKDLTLLPADSDAAASDSGWQPPAAASQSPQPMASEAAPADAGKLVLNGVALRKEEVIAFVHFGHSNMEGRATGPEQDVAYHFTDTDPHGWMYRVGSIPAPAHEPLTACALASCMMAAGPGTALIKEAIARAPKKYFLSLGFGHANARCNQYLPNALYFDEATKAAVALKDNVTFAAIIIMLGLPEPVLDIADSQKGFTACMTKLVAAVREALQQPDLPVLFSDYEMGATGRLAPDGDHGKAIIPELHKLPSLIQRSALVPTDDIPMQDDHHFNLEGHKLWTQRVLDLMQKQGWFPWADPAPSNSAQSAAF